MKKIPSPLFVGGLFVILLLLPSKTFAALPRIITGGTSDQTPGVAVDIALQGNYAYLANGAEGLQIQDITDPKKPIIVGSLDTYFTALGVAVSGNYAYVAAYDRLYVVDVQTPSAPSIAAELRATGDTFGSVKVSGDYAYIISYPNGLEKLSVVDISTPTSPRLIGTYTPEVVSRQVYGLAVSDQYAYLVGPGVGLQIVNFADPTSPQLVGSLEKISDTDSVAGWNITVSNGIAYINDLVGLRIINVSDPTAPSLISTYSDRGGMSYGIAVNALTVYTTQSRSLFAIDATTPTAPVLATSYSVTAQADALASDGTYLYVADEEGGLQTINIAETESEPPPSSRTTPTLLGSFSTSNTVYGLDVSGHYVYLANYDHLTVVDATDSSELTKVADYIPHIKSKVTGVQYITDVVVKGNRAYLVVGGGVEIVDISDPANPAYLGGYMRGFMNTSLAVSGNYVFLGVDRQRDVYYPAFNGLEILDVSDATTPKLIGSLAVAVSDYHQTLYRMAIEGDTLYAVQPSSGLVDIFNVSDPSVPKLISETKLGSVVKTVSGPVDINAKGKYAYLADLQSGFSVVDMTDKEIPVVVGTFDQLGNDKSQTVDVIGNRAYVGQADGTVLVLDVTHKDTPSLLTTYKSNYGVNRILVTGEKAYLATTAGMEIVDISDKTENENSKTLAIEEKVVTDPFLVNKKIRYATYTFTFTKPNAIVHVLVPTNTRFAKQITAYSSTGSPLSFMKAFDAPKGFTVSTVPASGTRDGYLALGKKGNGTKAMLYRVTRSGLQYLGTITVGAKNLKRNVNLYFLPLYGKEYGLVTMIGSNQDSLKVWRYSAKKQYFVQDKVYQKSKLKITNEVISL